MSRYVVSITSDAPSYWSALFNDGSVEQLDAVTYSEAREEADQRFGVSQTQQIELEEEFD
ncbi:MAG: hypothetical protein EBX67_05315 [Betaproteobacteria bacterium]|nr:hypothetical protein [Betaproteobacteria bacterium]NCZ47091.1 hypothetical protein [Betaproteobacteria bacterium]NCZ76365.1 hypothetical protein [Betaproteobacteria bacterium]NDA52503.1 hypothetical protein [Betaproteobacteria bacterium]NDA70575.1 hypothetical protein [Betaproteobacteria bacterium]